MRRVGTTANGRASAPRTRPRLRLAALLAVAAIALASDARAQVVNFRHYTIVEGLPQSQVLAIRQDRHGYLWFATYGGLSRFDGGEFHTYTTEDGLSSNSVWDIGEDQGGRLLLATSGGLCIRDAGRFQCIGQKDGLVNDLARSVAADRSGGVWVGTARGLSYVSRAGIRNYTAAQGLPSDRINNVVVDSGGRVWVATGSGLARLVGDRFVSRSTGSPGDTAIQFIAQSGDALLEGVDGRLFLWRGDVATPVAEGQIPAGTIFVDGAVGRDSTIWVVTRTGALRIRHGRVDRLGVANGFSTELINRVTIDREGDVWFGTEYGASKHVPGPFRTYTVREGLPSPFVRSIVPDDEGRLWIGTRNGVAVQEGERFRPVPLPGVPDNRVYGLARAPGGGMLIGTRRGLILYRGGRLKLYREADGLPSDVVYSLTDDGRGGVWIGTDRGLARWEAGRVAATEPATLSTLSIVSMARDASGRLWLGRMTGGIVILDGDSVRFLGAAQGATDQTIWALGKGTHGEMWAATNGDGALRIDERGGIRRFTMRDGLASNFLWQVLADTRGDIWLFGNLGLDRFTGERMVHYGRGAGLIELEGSADAARLDRNGDLWFGTGAGVVKYSPDLDVEPTIAPSVFIEDATNNGASFSHPAGANPVRLERGVVQIRFSSPSYRDESAIRFRYRLEGSGVGWSAPTAERSISYAGLAPGRYRFEVMALNGALQSLRPAGINFTVMPAFWQSWWFRLLALLILAVAAAAVPVVRARALERERRRLEALVARHTHELAEKNVRLEQSNRDLEHFAYVASHDLQEPLRKIQAFSDRVTKQYADRLDEQGLDYLSRMGGAAARMQRLIDDLLSLSRVTTKRNAIEPIELGALAQEVLGDLEFRIQSTHGRVELGDLPRIAGDPVQIRQIFQNLIGNALKFHRPDESPVVTVSAVHHDDVIELRFDDNGIGFESKDAEKVFLPFQRLHGRMQYEGTGIGLTICQKIAERHGGAIRAESRPGQGSRFVVTLPVNGPSEERHAA